jgi:hypothetical protein
MSIPPLSHLYPTLSHTTLAKARNCRWYWLRSLFKTASASSGVAGRRHQATPNPVDHRLPADAKTLRHLAGRDVLGWLGMTLDNLRQLVDKLCIFGAAFLSPALRQHPAA